MFNLKLTILFIIFITVSGCSEFALIASGSSVAISHNSYVRAYNGLYVMTIMATEKDIKRHIYDKTVIHFKELKR
jgi:hypothetical protein